MKGLNLRIKKVINGWNVEIENKKWYGKKYWKPIIFYRGTSEAYHFDSIESAKKILFQEIRSILILNKQRYEPRL